MTLQDLLDRLQSVTKSGGGYVALCPSHEDRLTSLSLKAVAGKILLHCFAGCPVDNIVAALGLTMADLREEPAAGNPNVSNDTKSTIVATYDYRDETGSILFQVVRLDPKSFRQRRPDGEGWIWGLGDTRRVIYRLPDLTERARVVWVEGEKDVDRLWSLDIPSSTSMGGAQAWRPEYAEQLYRIGAREVLVVPDNDVPGEAYAARVVTDCIRVGIEARVVPLPGAAPKGDVSDWLDAGKTAKDLLALFSRVSSSTLVLSLSEALDAWEAERDDPLAPQDIRTPFYSLNSFLGGGFSGGELIYVGSRPGLGKTALALAFAKSAAVDENPTLVISREMVVVALAQRMVTQESGIETALLKRPRSLSLEDAEAMTTATLKLRALPIWLTDKTVTIDEIVKVTAEMVRRVKLRFLIVDYLQLIRPPRDIRDRRLQVEFISQSLKGLAVEHRIPVVCLSSLSRPEKNSEKPPTLADLRESGELEHDADVVLLLHRKNYLAVLTQCIIAKNRSGSPGAIEFNFYGKSLSFSETSASVEAS